MKNAISYFIRLTNGDIIKVDKMLHFSFSFIIASLFTSTLLSMVAVILLGTVKELFDRYIKKTKFDIWDLTSGILGGLLYLTINYLKQ